MKKITLNPGLKMAAAIVCLLNINNSMAQLKASGLNNTILKPKFEQVELKRVPVKFGLGVETYVSGNAHGAYYSGSFNISKDKSVLSLSPCLQKRSLKINGIKAGYSYLLSGINDRYDEDELNEMKDDPQDILELRVLCYVQYLHNASLSYTASRVETITSNESKVNFNQLRLSTIEAAVCMELDVNLKGLKIRNYMGCSFFYHQNYIKSMYRPKWSPALVFGTGIIIPKL